MSISHAEADSQFFVIPVNATLGAEATIEILSKMREERPELEMQVKKARFWVQGAMWAREGSRSPKRK
jgi:hypothetical protein